MENAQELINENNLLEQLDFAVEFLKVVYQKLGITIESYEILEKEENNYLINIVSNDDSSLIFGKRGKNLDAVYYLLKAFLFSKKYFYNIELDINHYKEKMYITLEENIVSAVNKVIKYKKAFLMKGPYSPVERKFIHLLINQYNNVKSESAGDGFFKSVWIFSEFTN